MNLEEIFDSQILDQYYQKYNLLRKEKKSVLVCSVRTLKRAIIMYQNKRYYSLNTRLLNIAAQKTQYFLQQWH